MKVSELIEALAECPQSLDVVVDGYEGGYTESITLRTVEVVTDVNPQDYYGEHEAVKYASKSPNPRKEVLVISRYEGA